MTDLPDNAAWIIAAGIRGYCSSEAAAINFHRENVTGLEALRKLDGEAYKLAEYILEVLQRSANA